MSVPGLLRTCWREERALSRQRVTAVRFHLRNFSASCAHLWTELCGSGFLAINLLNQRNNKENPGLIDNQQALAAPSNPEVDR
jgi:hypothetical protein